MRVLGIESTCDETACAIVENGKTIFANIVASQVDLHKQYGGVFPELACRQHVDTLIPVIESALIQASLKPQDIDLIAVAKGPGLIGALLIGLNTAKTLSLAWNIPFIGVNHVEAHLYAAMMPLDSPPLPGLGLVISGGHTFMVKIEALGSYTLIGTTLDDAIGEAFDKVAAILGLPYPGGPAVEVLALSGNPHAFPFKPCRIKGNPWDFSFSGLKTHVLYTAKGNNAPKNGPLIITEEQKSDVAASFQEAAFQDIISKTWAAVDQFQCQAVYIGGGVSNNQRLKEMFSTSSENKNCPVYFPEKELTLDNAAMIAGLGYHAFLRQGGGDSLSLEPMIRIPLGQLNS